MVATLSGSVLLLRKSLGMREDSTRVVCFLFGVTPGIPLRER